MLPRVKAIDLLTVVNAQELAIGHNEENISINPTVTNDLGKTHFDDCPLSNSIVMRLHRTLKVLCINMSREYLLNIVLFDHRSNWCMEYHYEWNIITNHIRNQ